MLNSSRPINNRPQDAILPNKPGVSLLHPLRYPFAAALLQLDLLRDPVLTGDEGEDTVAHLEEEDRLRGWRCFELLLASRFDHQAARFVSHSQGHGTVLIYTRIPVEYLRVDGYWLPVAGDFDFLSEQRAGELRSHACPFARHGVRQHHHEGVVIGKSRDVGDEAEDPSAVAGLLVVDHGLEHPAIAVVALIRLEQLLAAARAEGVVGVEIAI